MDIEEADYHRSLHSSMDAIKWAKEFCRVVGKKIPAIKDEEDWMSRWFAHAIMTGYDEAHRRMGLPWINEQVGCSYGIREVDSSEEIEALVKKFEGSHDIRRLPTPPTGRVCYPKKVLPANPEVVEKTSGVVDVDAVAMVFKNCMFNKPPQELDFKALGVDPKEEVTLEQKSLFSETVNPDDVEVEVLKRIDYKPETWRERPPLL